MTQKDIVTKTVSLSSVSPDADQPRKNFDASKLAQLMRSIEKHGIINPLVVEEIGKGEYLLVDGERRYRAAKELGLKQVPVNIIAAQSPVERLVRQFHLQEQHEGWSPVEKAKGVLRLAKHLSLSIEEVGTMLSLNSRTIRDYMAFGQLIAGKDFEKSEIPLNYAHKIFSLRNQARAAFLAIEEEFTQEHEEKLEKAIIARVKAGDIRSVSDIVKIKDAVKMNPKSIKPFMSGNMSVAKLFLDSNAKTAAAYRNTMFSANYIYQYIARGIPLHIEKMLTEGDISKLKRAKQAIDTLIAAAK